MWEKIVKVTQIFTLVNYGGKRDRKESPRNIISKVFKILSNNSLL